LRHDHRTGLLAQPGRGLDTLDLDIFSALRSFVLLAPLTFFAEAEGWKLTAALCAIWHEKLKVVRGADCQAAGRRESTLPI
jgi:hypothetical protein